MALEYLLSTPETLSLVYISTGSTLREHQTLGNITPAEEEIQKQIQLPVFTPAPKMGDIRESQPISSQTKGDVERELAQAGISRLTYGWRFGPVEDLAWNLAVVDVMAWKLVEWIRLSSCITDDIAAQALAIVLRWIQGKCREIQEIKNQNPAEYETQKKVKLAKAQFTQWRKKANPRWLKNFTLKIISLVNKQVYSRSKSKYRITKGINGVPRGLPRDCYSAQWWNGLGQYKKDIVSKVEPFGMGELAAKLGEHMSKNQHPRPGPNAGPSNQTGSTHQVEESHQEGEPSAGGTEGVMHVT
ncbi:hypothetical protein PCASD_23446 [Puccinia coronata f. sp. avenae]|uniref:Uncharacterized protein n=1 Tax=Puccinia coronata f. sp. avenae TaxID=200324 RepID=A0A2N5SVX5_9BASI|nr:hypothetical protein PCASD_23446 [Puccinia coronata f. sp. avenae]